MLTLESISEPIWNALYKVIHEWYAYVKNKLEYIDGNHKKDNHSQV